MLLPAGQKAGIERHRLDFNYLDFKMFPNKITRQEMEVVFHSNCLLFQVNLSILDESIRPAREASSTDTRAVPIHSVGMAH
jgi:hypothetical protein